jgi:hypothetical protein
MREDILQALSELIKEKTELKAEKIELGKVDELVKLIKSAIEDRKEVGSAEKKTITALKSYSSKLNSASKNSKKLDSEYEKIFKEVKQLGINPNDIPALKAGKPVVGFSNVYDKLAKQVKSMLSNLSS